jgi:hypothetical protein
LEGKSLEQGFEIGREILVVNIPINVSGDSGMREIEKYGIHILEEYE